MKTAFTLIALVILASAWPLIGADKKIDASKFDLAKLPPAASKTGVTYAKDIRPMFDASCFRCHGEQRQKGDLRLDTLQAVLKGGEDGKVVLPGDSKHSLLVAAVAQIHEDIAMPPKGGPGGGRGPGGRPPGASGSGNGASGNGNPPPGGPNPARGPGGSGRPGGPGGPPKALTAEQVGLVRAWIDQGAK